MALDPKNLGELQKALNEAAGKASVLWTTFVTFQLYLMIAVGSVTHRDLFLETPLRLPVLNADLPLVGFFMVAPTVLVILHFYVFLQLLALAAKSKDYDKLLRQQASADTHRQYLRQRLNSFFVLQSLAGPREQRRGISLRMIAWLTLVGTPVLILLQEQVRFLPYHREWVVWLQRIVLLVDLAVIWYFWNRVRSEDDPIIPRIPNKGWRFVGAVLSVCGVFIFSVCIATFPGEWLDQHLPVVRCVPRAWWPHWSSEDDWTSLQELLFAGAPDEVSGQPSSWFSNRLILTDQSFVDLDKLDKATVSRSLRGRDLRQAVLNRTDLRKADFTGAMLDGASFKMAELQSANFSCATPGKEKTNGITRLSRWPDDGCTSLRDAELHMAHLQGANLSGAHLQGANLNRAQLQHANLSGAQLQGAKLNRAQLQGADFSVAELQGAHLNFAQPQGANLSGAQLQGADLNRAQLQGADLNFAQLQGADLNRAQLQGASLSGAKLQGANLSGAILQGAYLRMAHLQGAELDEADLQGAFLANVLVWRAWGTPIIHLAYLDELFDAATMPWRENAPAHSSFAAWRKDILSGVPADDLKAMIDKRLWVLDPESGEPREVLTAKFWEEAKSKPPHGEERQRVIGAFLADLGCASNSAPYIAGGLVHGLMRASTGRQRAIVEIVVDRLRKGKSEPAACPGIKGLTDDDWAFIDQLVAHASKPPSGAKAGDQGSSSRRTTSRTCAKRADASARAKTGTPRSCSK